MKGLIRGLRKLAVISVFIIVSGCLPVDTILKDPGEYYVPQDPELCGYTAFYMALKYRKGHLVDTAPDVQETITYPDTVTKSNKIYEFIDDLNKELHPVWYWTGLYHDTLYTAAQRLYNNDENESLFDVVDSNLEDVSNPRSIFEEKLRGHLFLDTPVIIHMDRPTGVGHFLVLVGYEVDGNDNVTYVHFMDPWRKAHKINDDNPLCECMAEAPRPFADGIYTCFVQKIEYETFINDYWYQSNSGADARWDGIYIAFR